MNTETRYYNQKITLWHSFDRYDLSRELSLYVKTYKYACKLYSKQFISLSPYLVVRLNDSCPYEEKGVNEERTRYEVKPGESRILPRTGCWVSCFVYCFWGLAKDEGPPFPFVWTTNSTMQYKESLANAARWRKTHIRYTTAPWKLCLIQHKIYY